MEFTLSRKVEFCCATRKSVAESSLKLKVEPGVCTGEWEVKVVRRSGAESAFASQAVQQAAWHHEVQPVGQAPGPRPIPVSELSMSDYSEDRTWRVRYALYNRDVTGPAVVQPQYETRRSYHNGERYYCHYREVRRLREDGWKDEHRYDGRREKDRR